MSRFSILMKLSTHKEIELETAKEDATARPTTTGVTRTSEESKAKVSCMICLVLSSRGNLFLLL